MKEWTFVIDVAKCHNCNNCLIACKDEHVDNDWPPIAAPQPQHGHYWMNLNRKERGSYPLVDTAYLPQPCQHCDEPECLKAAKDGAIYKRDDGIVIIDPEKSKGQMDLVDACPYGAIYWNQELAIPQKCTMCAHLLDEGWSKPRCVQACPTGALSFVLKDESKGLALDDYKKELGTKPRVKYKNLYRFDSSLICGSVALVDINECAEDAVVKLASGGKEIAETTTNNYGDFYFDGLPAGGGSFSVTVSQEGRGGKSLNFETTGSINLGVIYL
jgi:Fe-S-cluster-containing dehydrogenase component